jgi:hypothetical protein
MSIRIFRSPEGRICPDRSLEGFAERRDSSHTFKNFSPELRSLWDYEALFPRRPLFRDLHDQIKGASSVRCCDLISIIAVDLKVGEQ